MNAKKSRSHKKQIEIMMQYMAMHNNLATGEFAGPLGAKRANTNWQILRDILKEHGPDRTVEQWRQTWKDLRKNAKIKKAAAVRAGSSTETVIQMPIVTDEVLNKIGHSTGVGSKESNTSQPIICIDNRLKADVPSSETLSRLAMDSSPSVSVATSDQSRDLYGQGGSKKVTIHLGPSTSQPTHKWNRLDDTILPRGDNKKQCLDRRTRPTSSFARETQPHLGVAIAAEPRQDLTQQEADDVELQIQKEVFAAVRQAKCCLTDGTQAPHIPQFFGKATLSDGVLKLWCKTDDDLNWLRGITPKLKPSKGGVTGFRLIKQTDIPPKVRSALYVPGFDEDIGFLHDVLSFQNPHYKMSTWSLYTHHKVENTRPGVFLILGIPADQIEDILARGRKVSYSTGTIYLRFFNGDNLSEVPPIMPLEPAPSQAETDPEAKIALTVTKVENEAESDSSDFNMETLLLDLAPTSPHSRTPWAEPTTMTSMDTKETTPSSTLQEMLKLWVSEAQK